MELVCNVCERGEDLPGGNSLGRQAGDGRTKLSGKVPTGVPSTAAGGGCCGSYGLNIKEGTVEIRYASMVLAPLCEVIQAQNPGGNSSEAARIDA